ncbi:hypothetical protein J3492_09650 [Psychrobacter sp. F1192]|uniref:Uncharacterized protein n=2 Tax=Psychrobacter coccoides TaxID=2818440 RepID=A0ABS3NPX6_9GAMM|nr:hypothetical protein [Psychrobacter coccoides]
MMSNTILLLTILTALVLLVFTAQKILAQNKTILQNEREIANIQTAITQQKAEFEVELAQKIKGAKKRSNNMQRNVLKGQISEQFTPFIAEVKAGNAKLNARQKIIKQAIENGQVSFKELRIKYCENTESMTVLTSLNYTT